MFSEHEPQRCVQDYAAAKMKLFLPLVSSFQPLTNFTKNPNIGTTGVLNTPLEHYNVF